MAAPLLQYIELTLAETVYIKMTLINKKKNKHL